MSFFFRSNNAAFLAHLIRVMMDERMVFLSFPHYRQFSRSCANILLCVLSLSLSPSIFDSISLFPNPCHRCFRNVTTEGRDTDPVLDSSD